MTKKVTLIKKFCRKVTLPTILEKKMFGLTKAPETKGHGCGSTNEEKITRSINLSFGVLIAVLNVVEIVIITKIKRKRKIYEILLLSLSVSDCLFGLSNAFASIIYIASICRLKDMVETAYTLYMFFVLTSIFHLLFITTDRLLVVLKPLKHRTYISRRRLYIFLAILWISAVTISGLLQILHDFTNTFQTSRTLNQTFVETRTTLRNYLVVRKMIRETLNSFKSDMQLVLSVTIIVADVAIVVSYFIIIFLTTFKRKKISTSLKKSNRLSTICVAIAATFVLFTLPYAATRFTIGAAKFWANFILVLNSGMNSIVYFFRVKIFRYYRNKTMINIKFNSHM